MPRLHLIGHPVGHSLSPVIQNAVFASCGLPWTYSVLDVPPAALEERIAALEEDPEVVGCNITVPHKVAAFRFLLRRGADRLDAPARLHGAVNTLYRGANGRWRGTSTDFDGFLRGMESELPWDLESLSSDAGIASRPDLPPASIDGGEPAALRGRDIAIIGSGGSAQTLATGFAFRGYGVSLHLFARSPTKAEAVRDEVLRSAPGARLEIHPLDDFAAWNAGRHSLVVQTTTVGMEPGPAQSPVPVGSIGRDQIAYDIVYRPHATAFLAEAATHGAAVVHGIRMLVGQGAIACARWLESAESRAPAPDEIEHVMLEALGEAGAVP